MTRIVGIMAVSAALGLACGSEETVELVPEPPQVDEEPAPLAQAELEHTGHPAVVGGHDVEILVHESGEVYVLPQDPELAGATLVVEVPLRSGATRRIPLRWDAEVGRFEGRLRRVQPVAGPAVIVLEEGGNRFETEVAVRLAPSIEVHVAAPATPAVRVEAPRPRAVVEVHAPTPRVEIHAPAPRVEVHAPAPRVQIRGKHKYRKHRSRGRVRVRGHGPHGRVDVRIR